jgi:hypothetical protein
MEEWSVQEKNLVDELVPLYCPKSTHYNEVASLYLTDSDTAIKQVSRHRYTAMTTACEALFCDPF